jgi:hypothetical protein
MYPTPTATDAKPITGGELYETKSGSVRARYGQHSSNRGLAGTLLYRTASARDYKGMSAKSWRDREDGDPTPTLPDQIGGVPNPMWVEWLMGFPLGWTDCEPSGTPSSPRSQSGSEGV